MFERRLKILLLFLLLVTLVLLGRATQVQIFQHQKWTMRASGLLQTTQTTETSRGQIFDLKGRPMAIDVPCTDACVDYRAVLDPPDTDTADDPQYVDRGKWLDSLVSARLKNRLGSDWKKTLSTDRQKELRKAERALVNSDIETMWKTLAELYQPTDDATAGSGDHRAAVEEIRHGIVQRVEMRRRLMWYRNFQRDQTRSADVPGWERWLTGASHEGPQIDNVDITVDEQQKAHVILRAIDADTANFLGKRLEQFPGLVLAPSTHRLYPMKQVACHVLGRLSRVSADDIDQAHTEKWDETRMYLPNDQIGREGIEALCEPLLRGSRGRIERRVGDDVVVDQKSFVPGADVHLTIDADLQNQVQDMLQHVRIKSNNEFVTPEPGLSMHGAAVVIDVKTGELRVLASNPGFDLNDLDDRYAALIGDHLNDPLRDRATSDEFEPGSTVKPMVGLGAITLGVLRPTEGIECTGFLRLPVLGPGGVPTGKFVQERNGRCWVASEWGKQLLAAGLSVGHHPIPQNAPHRGHDGNPDGWLSYSDAIERSCNVFFETVADRLGPDRLAQVYDEFGFGRITGVGIFERHGLRPGMRELNPVTGRMTTCFAGIGQGQVWATPLQIANEAATIARDGIWVRPHLLSTDTQSRLDIARPRPEGSPPDRVDLHLDPQGLRQAKIGMVNVINGPAGTGGNARRDDMLVAGKTGSAQAARLWQTLVDQNNKVVREPLAPANPAHPSTGTEWYRSSDADGNNITHAWFMGFAPAEEPEVAFCVLVEYGGDGGPVAGPLVSNILEACVQHGYLHPRPHATPLVLER